MSSSVGTISGGAFSEIPFLPHGFGRGVPLQLRLHQDVVGPGRRCRLGPERFPAAEDAAAAAGLARAQPRAAAVDGAPGLCLQGELALGRERGPRPKIPKVEWAEEWVSG